MQLDGIQLQLVTWMMKPVSSTYRTPAHHHSFYEMGMVASGEATWMVDGHRGVRLRKGEAIVIAPERLHSENAAMPTCFCWVGFQSPNEILKGIPVQERIPLGSWAAGVQSIIAALRGENSRRPPEHELRVQLLLADLLLLLKRAAAGTPFPEDAPESYDRMESARLYLERNATEKMTIEQVARYHGLSLAHFEILFLRRFGCAPKQYQHQCRLRRIEGSIRAGIRSPKLLAAEHGFRDAAYFCRWFKKQTGSTPSSYLV